MTDKKHTLDELQLTKRALIYRQASKPPSLFACVRAIKLYGDVTIARLSVSFFYSYCKNRESLR